EGNRQSPLCCIPGGSRAVDAAAYHEQVELLAGESGQVASHVAIFYDSGMAAPVSAAPERASTKAIAAYWNTRIHDLEMTGHPVGTREFFDDLDDYRFDKLHYLPRLVDFSGFARQRLLEVGCGIGTDLVRFARGGAKVTGVDLSATAIDLARQNLELHGVTAGALQVAGAEARPVACDGFAVVYGHGVLQYTADAPPLVAEAHRALRPGGLGIFMVYNRVSGLTARSKGMGVELEHGVAPVLVKYSIGGFR